MINGGWVADYQELAHRYAIVTVTSLPLSATAKRGAGALFAEISKKPVLAQKTLPA